jgi:transcriptional regulator with XRE-family HTH domain
MSHWTQSSVGDFVYSISLDFFTQLEGRIAEAKLPKKKLAERLSVTPSAVSQMLNSPSEKPELETLVKYALSVGSKVAVVLYSDDDPDNERGPVYSGIFEKSWEALNKPRDLGAIRNPFQQIANITNASAVYQPRLSVGTSYLQGSRVESQGIMKSSFNKPPLAVSYLPPVGALMLGKGQPAA